MTEPATGDAPDIAIFLPSLAGGGAERVFAMLANGFVARGCRVDLLLASAHGPYLTLLDSRVRVVDLKTRGVLAATVPLARYLRREQPRAVLAALSHANVVAIAAHRLAGSKARLVVSERLSLAAARRHHRSLKDRAIRAAMRLCYGRADAIVTVAEAMIAELEHALRLPRAKLLCIYNPVVDDALRVAARQSCPHPWLDGSAPSVILGCGRLSPQKDFQTLIDAFAILRRTRELRLVILGEGEDRLTLEARASQTGYGADIDLPGFVENPFSYMRAASVFVLSSLYEGMPGALIQAMACETRVVSTDCPTGPAEILEGGIWGRLVALRDPAALAEAIAVSLDTVTPQVERRAAVFDESTAVTRYLEILGVPERDRSHAIGV